MKARFGPNQVTSFDPMIGVGGISSKEDAAAKFKLGADLIQIYTSFIYRGPALVRELVAADCMRHANP